MEENLTLQLKPIMIEMSIEETQDISETNVRCFVKRNGCPDKIIKTEQDRKNNISNSNTLFREFEHVYETFEGKNTAKKKKQKTPIEYTPKVKVNILPVIKLGNLLKNNPSVVLDDNITEIVLTKAEIKSIMGKNTVKTKWSEIKDMLNKPTEFGNIPDVKRAISEIISESSYKAARQTIDECKQATLGKISKAIADRSIYVNMIGNTSMPLHERIVFLKQGVVSPKELNNSLYGVPFYTEHIDSKLLDVLKIKKQNESFVLVSEKIASDSLVFAISKLIIPMSVLKEGNQDDEIINTITDIGNNSIDLLDSQLRPLFEITESNTKFIAMEIYSSEILARQVNKLFLDKKELKKELSFKIGSRKPIKKTFVNNYNPSVQIYNKPVTMKHSLLGEILEDIDDETQFKRNHLSAEFMGVHGETFDINQENIKAGSAVCSIASILVSSDVNTTDSILQVKKRKLPASLEQQTKVVSRRLAPNTDENMSVEEVKKYMNTQEGEYVSVDYVRTEESTTEEITRYRHLNSNPYAPEAFGSGFRFNKIKDFINEHSKTILGYNLKPPTSEELSRIAYSLGLVAETEYKGSRYVTGPDGDKIEVDRRWERPSKNKLDNWSINTPEIGVPITHASGTMIDKPGNMTWYYSTRCDRLEQALDWRMSFGADIKVPSFEYNQNNYYEGDAKFHTTSENYEFFNTRAIRKYMGFSAPFIGPAYDAIQNYAIDPKFERKFSTTHFSDNIREKIHTAYLGIPLEEECSIVTKKPETLADCVRKYGWLDDIASIAVENKEYMYRDMPDESGPENCKAPYHNLGPDEYDSFLKPTRDLNSYKTMDMVFKLYMTLGPRAFEERMKKERPFETDWFNPYTTASKGFSKYLWQDIRNKGFELLPAEAKLRPSMPGYYEDALMFENIEKKDHNPHNHFAHYGQSEDELRGIHGEHPEDVAHYLSMEEVANLNNLSKPLGIEPYTEPFGSSRTGDFKRPFESLRLLNTLSRTKDELMDRKLTIQEECER